MSRYLKVELNAIDDTRRARKDLGDLVPIKESIEEFGVFQPITISPHPDEVSEFKYILVAGGRRLAASRLVKGLKNIPSILRTDLDELDRDEIEMLENIQRKDFIWHERVDLTYRIDQRMREKAKSETNKSGVHREWSIRKTARLINRSFGGVQRQLDLHKLMQELPMLRELENEDQAVKMARQITERAEIETVRKEQKKLLNLSNEDIKELLEDSITPAERERVQRVNFLTKSAEANYRIGDAFDGLRDMIKLKEQGIVPMVKLCEVDPPYGIDLIKQKKGEMTKEKKEYTEIDRKDYPMWLGELTSLLYNALPNDCHVVFWYGYEWYDLVISSLEHVGFKIDKIPCVWIKETGQTQDPDRYLGRAHESFIYAWKGSPHLHKRGRINVFNYSTVNPSDKYHPTQRPINLMVDILETFTFPGEIVVSPFLGSGTTLLAAYRLGNLAFGWDLSGHYKEKFMGAIANELETFYRESGKEVEKESGVSDKEDNSASE